MPDQRRCPEWCAGHHSGDGTDIYHYGEIGRVEGGELTVVVSVTAWATPDMPDPAPAVTLMWHPTDPDDTSVCLQDGIEFNLTESEQLIPLLKEANGILRAEKRA